MGDVLDVVAKLWGYVFFGEFDMLDVALFVDMVDVDMFVLDVFLFLPLLLIPLPLEREGVEAFGPSAFFLWQSTQYNKNLEMASLGIKAYRSAT